jgi:hypothetical protein
VPPDFGGRCSGKLICQSLQNCPLNIIAFIEYKLYLSEVGFPDTYEVKQKHFSGLIKRKVNVMCRKKTPVSHSTYPESQVLRELRMNSIVDLRKGPKSLGSCLFYMKTGMHLLRDGLNFACFVCLYLEGLFQRKLPR